MKKIIILIGPPGSGKGTQAKMIAKNHGYSHISTGSLFRTLAVDQNTEKEIKSALQEMKEGALVPDWLVYRVSFKEIDGKMSQSNGVVLDGAIRTVSQAENFQQFFHERGWGDEVQAIEVAINDDVSFERLATRRVCEKCGEITGASAIDKCQKCGGELVLRKDDSNGIIKKRIEDQGNNALRPILDYYEKLGILKRVDGSNSIDKVAEDLESILCE
jgi:adenylate kinase